MMKNNLKIIICCGLLFSLQLQKAVAQDSRPNIVVLFADDLGYSDLGCYGGEIETPNLDKLANEGIRFRHFINGSKCAPSRASLLTGLYPIETGCVGPPDQMVNGVTISEMLRKAGYKTLMTGKWHGLENPAKRGFDNYFGITAGAFNYFKPKKNRSFWEDDKRLDSFVPKENFYTTDEFTNRGIDYLEEQKNSKDPFFLYVAYNAPHFPLQAWPEDIAKYRGKYLKGWDKIRADRFKRQRELGIIPKHWKLSERDEKVSAWEAYENKDIADLTMATYAAMVDRMDQNIGKLLDKLDAIGKKENTIVIFLSDNGGNAEGHMWDGKNQKNKPGEKDSQAKLGIEWANASNTPFKSYKRSTFNGGQVTPFIVNWPNGNLAKGSISNQKGNITDLMPTFLELANATYPEGDIWTVPQEGNLKTSWKVKPLSGRSLVPAIKEGKEVKRDNFKGYFQGSRMLIAGDLKIVSDGGDGAILHLYDYPWELYDLKKDGTETENLANQYPNLVDSLDIVYRKWIDETDRYTGLKSHEYYQQYYTKEQKVIIDKLEKDNDYKKLMSKRKQVGVSIVEKLASNKVKLKTFMGMDKLPMSYFAVVGIGREKGMLIPELKNLYDVWDKKSKAIEKYCKKLGPDYLKLYEIQERIRLRTTSLEVN
ncbi:arylsulfatase [Polaribacter sp. Z014]|uniref:arylsulfatase n=1 Tax=Polaribacter sp. Z014 TaxID=2927126 RepID=UPI00201FBFA4|nr:arylsulfatase [Polaribacter sp. Z014]MCL7762516.1 arylsulfatase [Polaribacter sp. Z014]